MLYRKIKPRAICRIRQQDPEALHRACYWTRSNFLSEILDLKRLIDLVFVFLIFGFDFSFFFLQKDALRGCGWDWVRVVWNCTFSSPEPPGGLSTRARRLWGHRILGLPVISNDLKSRTSNPVSPEPPGPRAQAPRRLWGREWELHGGTVLTQFPAQPRESQ